MSLATMVEQNGEVMSATATPTPWRYEPASTTFRTADDAWIMSVSPPWGHEHAACHEANAALIIRAVNNHDALVKALEGVIRVADRKTVEFDAARAALAATKETT